MQIWKKLFHDVIDQLDNDEIIIDSTVVKAYPCAAGYKKIALKDNASVEVVADLQLRSMLQR